MVALGDDVERLLVAGRDERAAGLALVEELLLADLVGLGVVADEDDLDAPVLGADELVEQEEEAPRQVLLHRVHRPRGVHDADHDRVRLAAHLGRDVTVDEVVGVEGEAARGLRGGDDGLPSSSSAGASSAEVSAASSAASRALSIGFALFGRATTALGRELAPDAGTDRSMLVEPDADPDLTVAATLGRTRGFELAQRLAFEVGQVEVLEHDVDQVLEGDVGLVVVDAGTVAGLLGALAWPSCCDLPTT